MGTPDVVHTRRLGDNLGKQGANEGLYKTS